MMHIGAAALIIVVLSWVSARPPFRIDGDSHVIESMKYFTVD